MTTNTLVAAVAAAFFIAPAPAVAARPADHPSKGHGARPAVPGPPAGVSAGPKRAPAPVPAPAPTPTPVDADDPLGTPAAAFTETVDEVIDDAPVVGPDDSLADRTAAYGAYCTAASKKKKKKAARVQSTPFVACVTALARLAVGDAATPAAACKGVSRKKVKGTKGTPYSVCVKAAAKLREDLEDLEDEDVVDEPATPVEEPTTPVEEPTAPVGDQ